MAKHARERRARLVSFRFLDCARVGQTAPRVTKSRVCCFYVCVCACTNLICNSQGFIARGSPAILLAVCECVRTTTSPRGDLLMRWTQRRCLQTLRLRISMYVCRRVCRRFGHWLNWPVAIANKTRSSRTHIAWATRLIARASAHLHRALVYAAVLVLLM